MAEGLLRKVPYREAGQRARSEYRRTEKGLALYPLIVALLEWGNTYAVSAEGPLVELTHRDCGAPVQLEVRCAEGHPVASARDVTPVPGPGARMIA